MTKTIGLDFETFGARNIKECGVYQYMADPLFQPLIATVAFIDGTCKRYTLFRKSPSAISELRTELSSATIIVAHNAEFEWLVTEHLDFNLSSSKFVDSAVIARLQGADSKLTNAAPQLLGDDKVDEGADLIKLFSVPNKHNVDGFNLLLPDEKPEEWERFFKYCEVDAKLALKFFAYFGLSTPERFFTSITLEMNRQGWPVDRDAVFMMQRAFERNNEMALRRFRDAHDLPDFNFNSHKQMLEFCTARGIKATSFDELNVQKLIKRIEDKLSKQHSTMGIPRVNHYTQVLDLLSTKQQLGGSSLRKLPRIIAQTSDDGRLRGQYMHAGAGQTGRTSGRGVQMQNLTRLDSGLIIDLDEDFSQADNPLLSANMRQLFAAPEGCLLAVGDLASIESRGLAWMAGEDWKVEAYQQGLDVYAKQAAMFYDKQYEDITKPERTFGKVGELSCGYGAGPGAVKDFAEKMGVILTDLQSQELVMDWRESNPQIVKFWTDLERAFRTCLIAGSSVVPIGVGSCVEFVAKRAPHSLRTQVGDPNLLSVHMQVHLSVVGSLSGHTFARVFHGVTTPGREIRYFKPRSAKSGPLWLATWMNPKTKRRQHYTLYGGKLAGILTQSLCREIFMLMLHNLSNMAGKMIGQFHDEVVFEIPKHQEKPFKEVLHRRMCKPILPGLPLAAEVGVARRYIK